MFTRGSLIFMFVAICLAPVAGLAQMTIGDRLAPGQPPVIIAHRAVGEGAPENSIAGLSHAIERGIEMVEVDIQITREGQYILMHDPNLTRTTNVAEVFPEGAAWRDAGDPMARKYMVSDFTLDDIAGLRLKSSDGENHPVATLDAALEVAEGQLLMILELKNWEVDGLAALLARHDTDNLLLFNQSDRWKLSDTVEATGIGVFATLERARDYSEALDQQLEWIGPELTMVDVLRRRLTPEFIAKAEQHGVRLCISGMADEDFALAQGDPGPWRTTLETPAAGYFTAAPDAVLGLLGR